MATRLITSFHRFMFLIIAATATAYRPGDQFLDVSNLNPKIYLAKVGSFVGDLQQGVIGNLPVLPVTYEWDHHPPTFDYVLKTDEHRITLRIRTSNLQPWGYLMQTPRWTTWRELKTGFRGHRIPGSKFLSFGVSNRALEAAAKTNITDVPCSKSDFINAVNQLAVTTDEATIAKSLILVLQLTVESAKFRDLEYHFANNFNNPSCRVKPYMVDPLEKNWKKLSTMVIKATYDKCYEFVPPVIEGNTPDTLEKLSSRFGILYRDPSTLKPPCTPSVALNDSTQKMQPVARA